jgi:endonuclease III
VITSRADNFSIIFLSFSFFSFSMRAPMTPLAVIKGLEKTYPLFKTALAYKTDWQLLFAVSLSAQTTDANVNRATAVLFTELPSIEAIANAPIAKLEKFVHSVGYYQTKAKNLKAAAKQLLSEYNGRVPATMEELITLPGVGRKTANVFLHVWHNRTEGVVVDTHIFRVSNRTGVSSGKTPQQVERDVMQSLDKKYWIQYGNLTIQHGRQICDARKPRCDVCPLNKQCPAAFQFKHFHVVKPPKI